MGQIAGIALQIGLKFALAAIFPPEATHQEGPKLADTRVSTSTYGRPIPIGFGRVRIGGNIIWAKNLEDRPETVESGGKGGLFSPSGSTTTHHYFGHFAVGIAEGPAQSIRRVWFDKKVVYDSSGNSRRFWKYPGAGFRFYLGTETQLPDPFIQEDVGTANAPGHRGLVYIVVESLPVADFGNSLPRLIEIEVQFVSTTATSLVELPNPFTGDPITWGHSAISPLSADLYSLNITEGANPGGVVLYDLADNTVKASIGLDAIRAHPLTASSNSHLRSILIAANGDVVIVTINGTAGFEYSHQVIRLNKHTLRIEDVAAVRVNSTPGPAFMIDDAFTTTYKITETGVTVWVVVAANDTTGGIGQFQMTVYNLRRRNLFLERFLGDSGGELVLVRVPLELRRGVAPGGWDIQQASRDRDGDIWYVGEDDSTGEADGTGRTADMIRLTLNGTQGTSVVSQILGPVTTHKTKVFKLNDAMSEKFAGVFTPDSAAITSPTGVAYDIDNHTLLIFGDEVGTTNNWRWLKYDIDQGEITGRLNKSFFSTIQGHVFTPLPQSKIRGLYQASVLGVGTHEVSATKYQSVKASDFTVTDVDIGPADGTPNTSLFHDRDANATIYPGGVASPTIPGSLPIVFHDRNTDGAVSLDTVISDLAKKASDITDADLDVTDSAITSVICSGYVIGQQMQVKKALEPLMFVYDLNGYESDFKLKFVGRGGGVVDTVPQDDLSAFLGLQQKTTVRLPQVRDQELELPQRVSLKYADLNRDHMDGVQTAQRIEAPAPTMYSRSITSFEAPIVLLPDQAKQAVEKHLYNRWIGRTRYQPVLGPKYIRLDPTDLIDVVNDSETVTMRVEETNLDNGFISKIEARMDDQATHVSASDGIDAPISAVLIDAPGPTEPIIMDMPLIDDGDIDPDGSVGIYTAFGADDATWLGAILQTSDDGINYEDLDQSQTSAPWGYLNGAIAALPLQSATLDPATGDLRDWEWNGKITSWDRTTTIDLYVVDGEDNLESISEASVLEGNNGIWLDSGEFLQFATVADQGGSVFRISDLLRGRRGTESSATFGAIDGTKWCLVDPRWVKRRMFPINEIGKTTYVKATTIGGVSADSVINYFTLKGNSRKPYPVVGIRVDLASGAQREPTVTWKARARIGGDQDLLDAVSEAENEQIFRVDATLGFEVVLMDSNDPDTLESKSYSVAAPAIVAPPVASDDPSVQILSADITAAGYNFAAGDALNIVIYQLYSLASTGSAIPATGSGSSLPVRGIPRVLLI